MAWAGCGIWSLVGQRVVAMGVRAMLLWGLSDWRPRAAFDAGRLRAMAPYSFRLLATDLLAVVGGSFDSKYGASYLEISSAERFRERDAVCDGC